MTSFLKRLNIQLIIIAAFSIGLNWNTITNDYALDDHVVILDNIYVYKGLGGIKEILSEDSFQGYFDMQGGRTNLGGGRYRPLSLITFAIEQSLFGETYGDDFIKARTNWQQLSGNGADAKVLLAEKEKILQLKKAMLDDQMKLAPLRHLVQIILFAISMMLLLYFLHNYIFKGKPIIAFFATLLFCFHPIHTEVIANLKSRDELLSFIFIISTFIMVFKYFETRKKMHLFWGIILYVGALFSKEYALVIIPLLIAGIMIIYKKKLRESAGKWILPFILITVGFVILRFSLVHTEAKSSTEDVLNDPYLYATSAQKAASKILVFDQYLKLLIFPHPLSSDYSYDHFKYSNFSNVWVWLSIILWLGILALTIWLWRKRHIIAFALLWFLAFFVLINNIFFNIGATMGERLIYHSSLGFCIIVAWVIGLLSDKIEKRFAVKSFWVIAFAGILILIPFGIKTFSRNTDWKNDFTLFTKDVKTVPNSALANANAGAEYFNRGFDFVKDRDHLTKQDSLIIRSYADTAIVYLDKALQIHPKFVNNYINRGQCYWFKGIEDSAISNWKKAALYFNGPKPFLQEHAMLFYDRAMIAGHKKEYMTTIYFLEIACSIDRYSSNLQENLGGSLFIIGRFFEAQNAFNKALTLDPNYAKANEGIKATEFLIKQEEDFARDSNNMPRMKEAMTFYMEKGFFYPAKRFGNILLRHDPNNPSVIKNLETIDGILKD